MAVPGNYSCKRHLIEKSIQFKAEKDRVLVPIGEPCPFGCKYCYTRRGEVGPARVKVEEILQCLHVFATEHEFATIQLGYDSDPFVHPERGITLLQRLAEMEKNIGFSTKALIAGQTLEMLADIRCKMATSGNTLSAIVSLSCWDSANLVEPHAPTPDERMETVKNLKSIDIPIFIAVRPILPHVDDAEYEQLVHKGLVAGCEGFILGPLYADDKGQFVKFIPPEVLRNVPKCKVVVSWSAHSPLWTRYEDRPRLQKIILMVKQKGGRVFTSSADAVKFADQRRKLLE